MLVLGVNASYHDSAAVLVRDGEVIAALEEERINRVKHTVAFPIGAVQFCLDQAQSTIEDVDCVAFNIAHEALWRQITEELESNAPPLSLSPRSFLARLCGKAGLKVDPTKFRFVPHHLAHAASSMLCSGFPQSLVLSVDGVGDDSVGRVASGVAFAVNNTSFARLRTMTTGESLGLLYGQITQMLGFRAFDEYKLMGLAPYGDPARFGPLFSESCLLTSNGWYLINRLKLITELTKTLHRSSSKADYRDAVYKDVAAACQRNLETIILHILSHLQKRTGLRNLAMAGGVALNCTLNSKVAESGIFEDIFVQPAAHDAGGALGAALWVASQEDSRHFRNRRIENVYWGSPLPKRSQIEEILRQWGGFVEWRRSEHITKTAAEKLATGAIIGWVQSRSEFGPRALGNRSILADPRPAENLQRVNRMVKTREGFRPLAPSVNEENIADYFQLPGPLSSLPFMLFVANVRPEMRKSLGAVTHLDGSARIQTVKRASNEKYWDLIREFGDLTGTYVLLNTSFNNSAEPIVDSVEDAIVAFITTGLDYLIIDDCLVTKRELTDSLLLDGTIRLTACCEVGCSMIQSDNVTAWARYRYEVPVAARQDTVIEMATFRALCDSKKGAPLGYVLSNASPEERSAVLRDIRKLWWLRLIHLSPPAAPRPLGDDSHSEIESCDKVMP
jgi:carbamoyltransferase